MATNKILKLTFITFLVFLALLIVLGGYWYVKIYKPKYFIQNLIQQNLKEDFWPQKKLQINTTPNGSILINWAKDKCKFLLSIENLKKDTSYAINVFVPEEKILTPTTSQQIFSSYFNFSVGKFNCSSLTGRKEKVSSCISQFKKKIVSIQTFPTKKETTISILIKK